jgi:hypothetical protein
VFVKPILHLLTTTNDLLDATKEVRLGASTGIVHVHEISVPCKQSAGSNHKMAAKILRKRKKKVKLSP